MRLVLSLALLLAVAAHVNLKPDLGPLFFQTRFEAEDGNYNGVSFGQDGSDFTGRGYVTGFQDTQTLDIMMPVSPGAYNLVLRYRSPFGDKTTSLRINGQPMADVILTNSAGWNQIQAARVSLGSSDTLTIVSNWGYYDIDNIELTPVSGGGDAPVDRASADPSITREARALLNLLQDNFGKRILSGQQDIGSLQWLESTVGTAPAILGCDFMDYSPSRVQRGSTSSEVETATSWDAGNGIVTFVWHWNAPTCLYDTPDQPWYKGFYTDATCFDLAEALAEGPGGDNYQLLLRDIDAIGSQLKRLSDSQIPVLFRPLHEAEGGWFWWGAKGPGPAIQLYQLIFNRITQDQNLHNIVWVWNSKSPDWYPGNQYVDIVSYDTYPTQGDHSPQTAVYDQLGALTGRTKVIALAEVGSIPDPEQCSSLNSLYAYFVTWGGSFITDGQSNPVPFLQQVYNSDLVVNLNRLPPNWKNQ